MKSFSDPLALLAPNLGLIGHRGVAALAPENTLASLTMAKALGLSWVEIDVRQNKHGELFIFHDETLERTTNGQGQVGSYDLTSLKQLDAGSWFSPTFKDQRILSLTEALEHLATLNLMVNLEIKCPAKTSRRRTKLFAQNLHKALTTHWPMTQPSPLVSSFNIPFIRDFRDISPTYPVGVLTDKLTPQIVDLVKSIPNCTLHCGKTHLTADQVKTLSNQGVKILVYTVNERELGLSLLNAGAFGLFVDSPNVYSRK